MSDPSADDGSGDSGGEPAQEAVSTDSDEKEVADTEPEGPDDSDLCSDSDQDEGYGLDHVLGLLSLRENSDEEDEKWERDMYRKVWRFMEMRNPGSTFAKAGPCTIMTGTSLELQNPDPGVISRTFLLRDAKLFNRAGGCHGHVIVKVVPYDSTSCTRFEQSADDTLREMTAPGMLLMMRVWLEGYTFPFLIDTGSQIDCIHANIWRAIGWAHPLTRKAEKLLNVTGSRLRCLGVWKVFVTVGTISAFVDLHVVEDLTEAGILGRPWQELNRMALSDTDDGVYLSIRSGDGLHTYGMLVTSPETQQAVRRKARELCASVISPNTARAPGEGSNQWHRYRGPEVPDWWHGARVASVQEEQESQVNLSLESTPEYNPWDWKAGEEASEMDPEQEVSEANLENQMYSKLLWQFCHGHRLPRAISQPQIESIEVYESDKLELREDWMTGISKKEHMFILRNVLVRIDGKYQEGHGVLRMVYFPHESERAKIANAALKEDHDTERNDTDKEWEQEQRDRRLPRRRVWPKYTQADLYQSMEEVAFETRNRRSVGVSGQSA
ncbi:hypothetical protein C8Q70DRAFT_927164 [Cubamyces menziesii]|nr:hypothetical protein C8Q70DRAFT_927164 [Cubamyces menziesii]